MLTGVHLRMTPVDPQSRRHTFMLTGVHLRRHTFMLTGVHLRMTPVDPQSRRHTFMLMSRWDAQD